MTGSPSSGGVPDLLMDDWPDILEYSYLFGHAERGAYYDVLENLYGEICLETGTLSGRGLDCSPGRYFVGCQGTIGS